MSERREGPQLPQELVGGVRVAVQDKLLQGASKEELQGARTKEPFAGHVVEQQLHQLWGEARQTAAVLHAGSCGKQGNKRDAVSHDKRVKVSHHSLAGELREWPKHTRTVGWGS